MIQPEVSVILLTYQDNPAWLQEAIDSVLQQVGVRVHLVVTTVQGDPAIKVAEKLHLEVLVNDHAGIYYQLNNALPLATKDWFVVAGGNDVLLPTKLIDEVNMCVAMGKSVCYSDFHAGSRHLSIRRSNPCVDYSYALHMSVGNIVPDNGLMKREILEKYGPFRHVQFGNLAFYDFWLRVAEGEGEGVFIHNWKFEWIYRICTESRHIQRKRNKLARRQHSMAIAQLQAFHRGHK